MDKYNSELLTVNEFIKDTNSDLSQSILSGRMYLKYNFYVEIEDVKWFYREDTEESKHKAKKLNSSAYGSANKWTPFDEIESVNLELEYRKMFESGFETNCIIQVLDNLYEVDLIKRECYSIYWESNPMTVMRSVWFHSNGEPFEEKSSNEIEKTHINLFRNLFIDADSNEDTNDKQLNLTSKDALFTLNIEEGTIIWYSKDEVYFEKKNMTVMDKMHSTLLKLRKKIQFSRIHRGYSTEFLTNESTSGNSKDQKEITHLVFVIHGIAQKLDRSKIYKCCDNLSKGCEKKKKEFFPQHKNQKFMFLPIDWRTSLVLDNGLVDSITIQNVQSIRSKLNYSALDIMYYSSPIYKTEIMNSLSTELNRLFKKFCEKNEYFVKNNGQVSLVAHSLGAVVVYDVLTSNTRFFNNYGEDLNEEKIMFNKMSQNDTSLLNEYLNCKKKIQDIEVQLMKSNENNITPLDFKIENLFCFGSPLAVFLALRGVRPIVNGTQDHILPRSLCKHLFNIFHPSDPVAYRLEPLISTQYSSKPVLEIQKSHELAFKASILFYKDLNHKRHHHHLHHGNHAQHSSSNKSSFNDETSSASSSSLLMPHTEHQGLENAIDFQLQEPGFELMAVLTSHNCYWSNKDVALFITSHLVSSKQY